MIRRLIKLTVVVFTSININLERLNSHRHTDIINYWTAVEPFDRFYLHVLTPTQIYPLGKNVGK